jgi:hypothetical protein
LRAGIKKGRIIAESTPKALRVHPFDGIARIDIALF